MRRFELGGERYWEVTLADRRVEMRWGPMAGTPQTFVRTFPTEGEAEVFIERQVIAQRERGYVEQTEAKAAEVATEVTAQRHQRFEDRASFVEVTLEGGKLTVRGGRIVGGKDVADRERLHVQHFAHVAEASAAFDERCASIRYQGARAIEPEPTHALHANPELEAQCEASPESPAPWAVYADWLIAQGDARGEIAALQLAGRAVEANRVLGAHLRDLCGTESGKLTFDYRHGFAVGCQITVEPDGEDLLEDIVRMVLESPMGRFLEALGLGLAASAGENDWSPTIHTIADSRRGPHVRALHFDRYERRESKVSWVPFGDFSTAWRKLPALQHLAIKSGAGGTLGAIDLPNLESFTRISGGLSHAEIESIVTARWPKLRHLEIWFGSHEYGAEVTVEALAPLFIGANLPALTSLGLRNCELVDSLIPALARSDLLPRLRALDLSDGTMAERGAVALLAQAGAFRHLQRLRLDHNYLNEGECEQIYRVLPNATFGDQTKRDDEDMRFVALGE